MISLSECFHCWNTATSTWLNHLYASSCQLSQWGHDDVIKWKHFPRCWPFVRGIHRSPANSPHQGQWRGVMMLLLICAWINGWINNREANDLRRHRTHYDITVMHVWITTKHNKAQTVFCLCIERRNICAAFCLQYCQYDLSENSHGHFCLRDNDWTPGLNSQMFNDAICDMNFDQHCLRNLTVGLTDPIRQRSRDIIERHV